MKNKSVTFITKSAIIAALYAALTFAAAWLNIAYGNIQFRFSEALTVLACFTPAAIPGLTVGCVIANITSPFGVMDIVLGSVATLLSAVCTYYTRKVPKAGILLPAVFSTVFNAVIVGLEIAVFMPEGFTWAGFAISALEVGAGEFAVCCLLGIPLRIAIEKSSPLKKLICGDKLS